MAAAFHLGWWDRRRNSDIWWMRAMWWTVNYDGREGVVRIPSF